MAIPVVFVVPAYNEEANLPRLLAQLEERWAGRRVVVVDDGSADGTAAILESYRGPLALEPVLLGRNQGPGAAFRAGFERALEGEDEAFVVTLEADTTSDLGALPRMLERAQEGADLVLAAWVMENVSPLRRLLSEGAGLVVRRALGLQATTVSSFFRVYRASVLRRANERYGAALIKERGFACKAELLAKLAAMDARIEEVPVALDTSQRVGESKMPVFRTFLAYWRMLARQLAAGRAA